MAVLRSHAKAGPLIAFLAVTAALYFGKDLLMPLAAAVLVAFFLAPVAAGLERLGLGRTLSVVLTTGVAFSVIGVAVFIAIVQLTDLANSLPRYKDNLRGKALALRDSGGESIKRLSETIHSVSQQLSSEEPEEGRPKPGATPMTVTVVDQRSSPLGMLREFSGALLGPIGTCAVVIVFVIFILLERTDLRDRFIHLIGREQLPITTQAIDEANQRVSRYLIAQLTVNICYGIPVGIGLALIGIPNAALWGILAALLRFIPYLGPWLGALPPLLLSFAISPGWWAPLATLALFVVLELVSANAVEPWLYGHSTGLSLTTIILAAAFWTWLWGPGGLLLATPLTVCAAVLGKYVPSLGFLDLLLGERPPISPEHRFYQRLLAGDENELLQMMEKHRSENELNELFDRIVLPALHRIEQDTRNGLISREEQTELYRLLREILSVLEGFGEESEEAEEDKVMIVPARSEGDALLGETLRYLLRSRGIPSRAVSHRTLVSEVVEKLKDEGKMILCISALTPLSSRAGEKIQRRLAVTKDFQAVIGLWWQSPGAEAEENGTNSGIVHSLGACAHLISGQTAVL